MAQLQQEQTRQMAGSMTTQRKLETLAKLFAAVGSSGHYAGSAVWIYLSKAKTGWEVTKCRGELQFKVPALTNLQPPCPGGQGKTTNNRKLTKQDPEAISNTVKKNTQRNQGPKAICVSPQRGDRGL
jgi:hypothetical protein